MATELINACKAQQFPSMSIMCRFGIDGWGGTNPIDIYECYRTAVTVGGVTSDDIDGCDDLSRLILNIPSVKNLPGYDRVVAAGGIQISNCDWRECPTCNSSSIHPCGCGVRMSPRLSSKLNPF